MKLVKVLMAISVFLLTVACKENNDKHKTTVIPAVSHFTDRLLSNLIKEQKADSGIIIVVNTPTGYVRAASGDFRSGNCLFDNLRRKESSSMEKVATWLAVLNSNKVTLADTVDTRNGIYMVNGTPLKDDDWEKGGCGRLTFHDAFVQQSNIATYLAASQAYKDEGELKKAIRLTGLDIPQSVGQFKKAFVWISIGYGYTLSAWDMVEYVNGIANQGKIVSLQLVEESISVNKESMDSSESIRGIRNIFEDKHGLWKLNLPLELSTGLVGFATQLSETPDNGRYKMELCGYFPTDNPQYTVYICIYKQEKKDAMESLGNAYKNLMDFLLTDSLLNKI